MRAEAWAFLGLARSPLLALLAGALLLASCDDRRIPSFARPPTPDAGAADDDAGSEGSPGTLGVSEGAAY